MFRSAFFALVICAVVGAGADAEQRDARPHKARYAVAIALQETAPDDSARILSDLSQAGYARATDRLGYLHLKGIGMRQDAEAAIALYQKAIAQGRSASQVSLAKAHLSVGAYRAARDTLEQASAQGDARAIATLAWAHATERLGEASRAEMGLAALQDLANQNDRHGQLLFLAALGRLPTAPAATDQVINNVQERVTQGDAKAAEALLRYYRERGHPSGTPAQRAALLTAAGLRDKVRIEEGLFLARDRTPARFWTAADEIMATAPNNVWARGLVVTSKLNKNAYVRILRRELHDLGYPVQRRGPYMTRGLIRAVNAFCSDAGITASCRQGPLKAQTIKAVAGQIAARRG